MRRRKVRKRRANPGPGMMHFLITVAAGVVTSLTTVWILDMMSEAREKLAAARPALPTLTPPVAPGQGTT